MVTGKRSEETGASSEVPTPDRKDLVQAVADAPMQRSTPSQPLLAVALIPLLLVLSLESVESLVVPQQHRVYSAKTSPRASTEISLLSSRQQSILFASTMDNQNSESSQASYSDSDLYEEAFQNGGDGGDFPADDFNNDDSDEQQFLKKTRPVAFLLEDTDDPITLLERNQQELSLSLGKLKASLLQEQEKSNVLEAKLAEAERIIAQQRQQLEETTVAQQMEVETLESQLAQSQFEQQKQQQELLLKQAKQLAQKEQQLLYKRVQELQQNLDVATYDLKNTNKEVTQVSRELIQAQNEINNLANKLENAQSKELSYKQRLQKLQDKLDAARGKLGVKQEVLFSTQRELSQAKHKLELQEKMKSKQDNANASPSPAANAIFAGRRPPSRAQQAPAPAPAPPAPKKAVYTFPLINNWILNENTGEVTGIVEHHPDIEDGTRIVTSALANPKQATTNAVVITKSGSTYKLGTPKVVEKPQKTEDDDESEESSAGIGNPFNFFGSNNSSPSRNIVSPSFNRGPPPPSNRQQELQERYQQLEFPLTGEAISNGRGTKYLLAGRPKRKPSGRSEIIMAYKSDANMEPVGDPVAVKLSTHKDKLTREFQNYQKIQKNGVGAWGSSGHDAFVRCFDFLPLLEGSFKYAQHSALVLEKGVEDLREYKSKNGAMDEATTKAALLTAAKCLESLHKARLVYTDLKAENLISMDEPTDSGDILFKGVDLESAVPYRGNPIDYTPEASPPEFAVCYLGGEAYDFNLEYNYDIWSFGMLAYELGTGRSFFAKKQPAHIMKQLGLGFTPPNVDAAIEDSKLCDLINKCLHMDPKQRLTASQIANHPYFKGDSPRLFGW